MILFSHPSLLLKPADKSSNKQFFTKRQFIILFLAVTKEEKKQLPPQSLNVSIQDYR